jgi:hypothetical protein
VPCSSRIKGGKKDLNFGKLPRLDKSARLFSRNLLSLFWA